MTKRIAEIFAEYSAYHNHPLNQLCHYIGIPMIVVSLFGLLSFVTFGNSEFAANLIRPDLGMALLLFGLGFYFYMDWKLALPFTLVLFGFYFLGRSLPLWALVALQIVGWVFQLVGHYKYEGKKPALADNLTHMLIGPIWIFAKWIGYAKPRT